MKKQHLFIILSVVLLGLVFTVSQYYQALKTEDVSAVTVGIPNPGHSLAQLECSADSLCVDTVNNRVGIGTNTPNAKLSLGTGIGDNKFYLYDFTGDKYGFGIRSSQLMIYSGAGGTNGGGITFGKYDGTTFTENVRFTNSGAVGIGTTTPATKLDINGSMTASGMPTIKCPITTSTAGNYMTLGATGYSNGNISCNSDSIVIGEAGLYLVGYTLGFNDYNHGWLMKNKNGGREMSFTNPATAIFSNSTILYLSVGDTLQIYHYAGTFTSDGNLKYIWATKLH